MTKLSSLLNIPGDNVTISPRSSTTGYNNLLGGYASKIIHASPIVRTITADDVGTTIVSNLVTGATVALTSSNINTYVNKEYGIVGTIGSITLGPIQDFIYSYSEDTDVYDDWGYRTIEITEDMVGRYILVENGTTSASAVQLTDANISDYLGTEQKLIRFYVGQIIYIYTNVADDNSAHIARITSLDFTFSSTMLQNIKVGVEPNDPEVPLELSQTSTSFQPQRVCYTFKGSSLEHTNKAAVQNVTSASNFYKELYVEASSLKTTSGWTPTLTKNGESFTAFSWKWIVSNAYNAATSTTPSATDVLKITFTNSQADSLDAEFCLTGPGGLDTPPSMAVIEANDFSYTVDVAGEYNIATGANNRTIGNTNANIGDFSNVSGIGNANISCIADIGGATNNVHEGTNIFIRGVNNFATGRDNYIFGGTNKAYYDSNLIVGGMNEAHGMSNVLIGNGVKSYSRSNIGFGSQIEFKPSTSFSGAIGRNLTVKAKEALLLGYDGELPEYEGNLAADNQAYATGDITGIHYKGAVAIAAGKGKAASSDKTFIPFLVTKYRWRKNPAFPWGSTVQAYRDRTSTLADRLILEYNPLVTINADIRVNGSIVQGDTQDIDTSHAQYYAWTKNGESYLYTTTETAPDGTTLYSDTNGTVSSLAIGTVTRWVSSNTSQQYVLYTATSSVAVNGTAYLAATCSGTSYKITAVGTDTLTANSITYTKDQSGIFITGSGSSAVIYTRDAGADYYNSNSVIYNSSSDTFSMIINGKVSNRYKVLVGSKIVTIGSVSNFNEFDTFKILVKNGGSNFSFPADWIPVGTIPSLYATGIDLFEVTYLENKYFYKHVFGAALA